MIDVVNLQRKVKIDTAAIRAFVASLPEAIGEADEKTFTVAFVSDRRMTQLNEFFRGKGSTTDVLSFPHEADEFEFGSPPYEGGVADASADGVVLTSASERKNHPTVDAAPLLGKEGSKNFLGDIVISAEQAQKQAAENKLDLDTEIKQLILHGLLHLCGYDHETDDGEMNARELALRRKLNI